MDDAGSPSVSARRGQPLWGLTLLAAANVVLYLVAALLHLGVSIPVGFATLSVPEPILPATVVEGLIAAGLAALPQRPLEGLPRSD